MIGLETDYITGLDLERNTDLLSSHPEIDYVVGSVHHVHGVPIDFDRQNWLRAVRAANLGQVETSIVVFPSDQPVLSSLNPDDPYLKPDYSPSVEELRPFLLAYFDAQYELFTIHQPEIIGHFDLCLLWTPGISLQNPELEGVFKKVERNVRYVVGYGGLFEANSAALRKGWETSYPGREVLEVIVLVSC